MSSASCPWAQWAPTTPWAVYELSEPLMSSESPASRRGYRRATRAEDCCLGFWRATWATRDVVSSRARLQDCDHNNQRNNQSMQQSTQQSTWLYSPWKSCVICIDEHASCRRSTRAVVSHLRAQQARALNTLPTHIISRWNLVWVPCVVRSWLCWAQ